MCEKPIIRSFGVFCFHSNFYLAGEKSGLEIQYVEIGVETSVNIP
jgi:hypothetical protein